MFKEERIVYTLPIINTLADCEREFPDVVIITRLNTYELFDEFYYKIYYALCACINKPQCEGFKIKFKFYPEDQIVYELSMPKLMLNMNAWRPLIELEAVQKYYHNRIEVLDESWIIGTMMSEIGRAHV